MKKITLFSLIVILHTGYAQVLDWASNPVATTASVGKSVVIDGNNNIINVGNFSGSGDFDPGAGTLTLTSAGGDDIVVSKRSSSNVLAWAFSIGSTGAENVYDVAVDASNNIIVVGTFNGTVDFDPSPSSSVFLSATGTESFIAKYNSSGAYVWAVKLGSPIIYGITTDASSNIYCTGSFTGTVDFNPDISINNLTSAGSSDVFVLKLNASNAYQFAFNVGGIYNDIGRDIALDANGNIYITGSFIGTSNVDFDPSVGTLYLTGGSTTYTDVFVAKYSSTGTVVWAINPAGTYDEVGFGLVTDASAIYVTGSFESNVDFDPGAGVATLSSPSTITSDAFLAKYLLSDGSYVGAFDIGSASSYNDIGYGVAKDASGNIYITGEFRGSSVDFDPGVGTVLLSSSSASYSEIYVAKYTSALAYIYAFKIGDYSFYNDVAYAIAVHQLNGEVVITGQFENQCDVDPGTGITYLNANGFNYDMIVARYGPCIAPTVSTHPADQSVCAATATTFSVAATGSPTFTYQWQVDQGSGFTNLTNVAPYSNVTTATLNISSVTGLNGYKYQCVVTGACAPTATSNFATLTVLASPFISSQPSSASICSGVNHTFTVAATGGNLTYQWQVNSGAGYTNISAGAPYSGETTASLTITGVASSMNGYLYRCIVSGCSPSATSSAATLTVTASPNVTVEPLNANSCPTLTATFSLTATGAGLTYQWQEDQGSGFANLTNNAPYSGVNSNTLTITGVTIGMNAYQYRCVVSGTCTLNNDTSLVRTLTVKNPPQITAEPSNVTICTGSNTGFGLTSNNSNNNNFQWQVDQGSGYLDLSDDATYSGSTNDTLSITNPGANFANYKYRCIVSGSCSPNDTSLVVSIVFNAATAIVTQPKHTTVCSGDTALFIIKSNGTNLTYQWQLDNGSGYNNISNGALFSGVTNDSLYVNNAQGSQNAYKFRCIVTGACGSPVNSNFGYLFINPKPTAALDISSIDTICNQPQWVQLVGGTPAGGVYSGTNVSQGFFDATTAGPGKHAVMYTYTNSSGCSDSKSDSILVEVCIGVVNNEGNSFIYCYPNPTAALLYLSISDSYKGGEFHFVNYLGEVLVVKQILNTTEVIDVSQFDNGIYFIVIRNEGTSSTSKPILIQK